MTKLTIAMIVVSLVAVLIALAIPGLCANGGTPGDQCDLTGLLRGVMRIFIGDQCRQTPNSVGCQLLASSDLTRK